MPEDVYALFDKALDVLEDNTFDTTTMRLQEFKIIQNVLASDAKLNMSIIERVLAICLRSMKDDKNCCKSLTIISSILKRIQSGQFASVPSLVPTALAIIDILKTAAITAKTETLQVMCFDTLFSYPDETLVTIATSHVKKITELFDIYFQMKIPTENRSLPCDLLIKLLKLLPQEKRTIFVKDNLHIWFLKLIPTIMNVELISLYNTKLLEALELLAKELELVEYSDNPNWEVLFEYIYNTKKYPLILKSLLDSGNPYWHRLWIVFIKLLKNQITRSNAQGSPINALLPVVESAFKMDVPNRCRAFKCWEVLIDNFSKETNEVYITKRLKLLIIPLYSNNAKVEETAIAKLNAWWHLIRKFQSKLNNFFDTILIAFLNFCFGKSVATPKATFVPGMISNNVKKMSVEAFINIAGHLDCPGCGSMPKLHGKLMNTGVLVCHWSNFAYCLRKAITIAADNAVGVTVYQAQCLWKSFVLTIGELPDNNVRRDIFNELLLVLENLTQDTDQCATDNNGKIALADLILNLIFSLFENDNKKIMSLLITKQETEGPMFKILSIILGPISNKLYNRSDSMGCVNRLKSVTKCILDEKMCATSHMVDWLMKNLSPNDNTLVMWTALAETILENNTKTESLNLNYILLWPLQNIDKFTDSSIASSAWYNLYTLAYTSNNSDIDQDLTKLVKNITVTDSNKVFLLHASLAILKLKLINGDESNIEEDTQIVLNAMLGMKEYKSIEKILLILLDTLNLLTSKIVEISNDSVSEHSLINTIKILTLLKQQSPDVVSGLLQFIEKLHKNIELFFKSKNSMQLKQKIIVELTKYATVNRKCQYKETIQLLNSCLYEIKEADNSFYTTIINSMDCLGTKDNKSENSKQASDKNNFTIPNTKVITRKAKKREASIVNTVVENGEEYVVVKSNWKFNPRKLTENQKEKLQRKREDIPALYQDLSQSQDEFKLVTWKTDSQDISTTMSSKSNSKTSDESASILKLMPSSDVVPKIIENIFSDSAPKNSKDIPVDDNPSKSKAIIIKDAKSPRVALKDRVFRNVRNLIEKSSLAANDKNVSENLVQIENVTKTPVSKELNIGMMTNSAPPKVNIERPSRVKRKPKKFDNAELFGLKKRRNSLGQIYQNNSQEGNELPESPTEFCNMQAESIETNNKLENNHFDIVSKNEAKSENLETDLKIVNEGPLNKSVGNVVVEKVQEDVIIHVKDDAIDENNVETENTNIEVREKEKVEETSPKTCDNNKKSLVTPKSIKKKDSQGSSIHKSTTKKSRIEKELAIDMVEGHPFLKNTTEKRSTRKNMNNSINNTRRTNLAEKINKPKSDIKTPIKQNKKKEKDKTKDGTDKVKTKDNTFAKTEELQEDMSFESIEDAPCSEDIIESSQDSTVTTISVKSTKSISKKALVVLDDVNLVDKNAGKELETQNMLDTHIQKVSMENKDDSTHIQTVSIIENKDDSKEDIEIPQNKTAEDGQGDVNLTETMDTEPFDCNIVDEIIVITDNVPIISLDTDNSVVGPETQELAEADTLPNNTEDFVEHPPDMTVADSNITVTSAINVNVNNQSDKEIKTDSTKTGITEVVTSDKDTDVSSPFKDDVQRKQDFLDNTLEISPIKTMSPDRDKKSPSPETSSDYVVITLSSPVQSNGEPFDKCDSPEIFTEEKISPDKRDQSPPREEVIVTNTSPSSSLSLKKNRPQVRTGGRAAQMLGLCVPDRLQTIKSSERSEAEEPKKSPSTTPARRNLRILYNSVGDNSESSEENEDFLKLKRTLPTSDSSPSVPILKRKLAEITDEGTVSPASKRKRVSFHDPPVSTTISVQKYIEPSGIRSPQNSAHKRQERQLRSQSSMKSPKRLDTAFKLDTVLNKAVESFNDSQNNVSVDDTQMTSLDETPVAEIVKTSDLNDADPICPDLVDCCDPIEAIASELSSPATKIMFMKELEGKIMTIGDLAKMTELEVNRLCIKAPKVKITKKVLTDYASKRVVALQDMEIAKEIIEVEVPKEIEEIVPLKSDVESQTDVARCIDMEVQTNIMEFKTVHMQTDHVDTAECSIQTVQSGSNSTEFVISSCLSERNDTIDTLNKILPDSSKQEIAESLQFDTLKKSFMKRVTSENSSLIISDVLEKTAKGDTDLSRLQTYLSEKYTSRQLVLFCSELLHKIHENSMLD